MKRLIVLLALTLSACSAKTSTFTLQANDPNWHSVGSGSFTLEVTGTIDFGGVQSDPNGVHREGPGVKLAKAPNLPFGAVIAKEGVNGAPIMVGTSRTFNTPSEVFIVVNDSIYEDNTGSYTVTKKE